MLKEEKEVSIIGFLAVCMLPIISNLFMQRWNETMATV